MRQISNTIKFISFYSSYLKKEDSSKSIYSFCYTNKIKISKKLLSNIVLCKYENNMNDLIRDLSKEIKEKKHILPFYTMIDEIYQNKRKSRNKKQGKNRDQSLLHRLGKKDPQRFKKLNQCFLEEAMVRDINVNLENFHYWCHTTNNKLKTTHNNKKSEIMKMTTNRFEIFIAEILEDIKRIKNKKVVVGSEEIIKSYETLGLDLGLNHHKIRQQYLKLTKRHHPDIGGSVEKMASINRAYHFLMSIEKYILKLL